MRRELAVTGAAPPPLAWERYADPSLWPTWSPQIASVVSSTVRLETGTTGVVRGHGGLRLGFTAEDVDDDARRWTWRVEPTHALFMPLPGVLRRCGRLRLEHGVALSGRVDGGSTTTLALEGAALVVLAYAPLAAVALRRLVALP
ncbi:Polyketide cyclase / dehydrase and lipid transport [Quadrisphaera granulorum]|uniref:Polyketide cyclase/dehydrase/lipid transport protein n=1 Tax=Quadrisphaera granulorum TaxID=317664 RepID=A0A315ZMX0_9ACTN|nr:SRPBCC family protein [Quadrisphaera granulorum]PWJ46493.1 polyketide cyclase/dehydrase/lipid transport protein [Quadrisphaera granulorum]SZE99051.1 Polyketide cyclase / dehydrase and lipid transport [Quadrisphaera granulorum]